MAMSSFVCLFVILSVCLTFFSVMFEHRNFYFGQLPRYGQLPKPIEIQPDQTMVIRLIGLKTPESYISLYIIPIAGDLGRQQEQQSVSCFVLGQSKLFFCCLRPKVLKWLVS